MTFENRLEDDWSSISPEAKLLISKMLQTDPNKRLSAKQALSDQWITKHMTNTKVSKIVL